jgi:hypothetical protein
MNYSGMVAEATIFLDYWVDCPEFFPFLCIFKNGSNDETSLMRDQEIVQYTSPMKLEIKVRFEVTDK